MIFSNKIAKIGRGNQAYIRKTSGGTFDVLISNDQTIKKSLSITGTHYQLGNVDERFIYSQMQMITDTLCVAEINNNYSVVEID